MNKKVELSGDEIQNVQQAYETVYVIADNALRKLSEITSGISKNLVHAVRTKLVDIDFRVEELKEKPDKADEALKLWEEWFRDDGDPTEYGFDGYYLEDFCFFCHKKNPIINGHEDNCIYIRAKTLVKGPLLEGLLKGVDSEPAT